MLTLEEIKSIANSEYNFANIPYEYIAQWKIINNFSTRISLGMHPKLGNLILKIN